jgi:hypothetical protein
MADSCFEQVVLDRELHQVVVDRVLANPFVVLDRLVVVAFESSKLGDLQVMLICQSILSGQYQHLQDE